MSVLNNSFSDCNANLIENVTNSTSQICSTGLIQHVLINTSIIYYILLLIPLYHISDALVWTRRKYGYYAPNLLVSLILALFFYMADAANNLISTSVVAIFLIYIVWAEKERHDASWEDEQDEVVTDFGRHRKLRVFFQGLSLVLIILYFEPLTWLDQRNARDGTFDKGMEWRSRGLLLLLTYHVFDSVQMKVYGRIMCRSSARLIPIAAVFLAPLLDEQKRKLDAQIGEQIARMYFSMYFGLFSMSVYVILKLAFIWPHPRIEIRVRERHRTVSVCLQLIFVYTSLFNCDSKFFFGDSLISGSFTRSLSLHPLVLIFSVLRLLLAIFIDFHPSLHFIARFVTNRRVRCILVFLNAMSLQMLYFIVLVWVWVTQGLTDGRLVAMGCPLPYLNKIWMFCENELLPLIFIRSFSSATAEQLASNDDVCLVCHEQMDSACVTPCEHFYHSECLLAWLNISNKCPLCQHLL